MSNFLPSFDYAHSTSAAPQDDLNKENCPANASAAPDIELLATVCGGEDKKDPLGNATMEDVVLTETATNVVALNRKTHLTRLQKIQDLFVKDIEVRSLRLFCGRVGIPGVRSLAKLAIAEKIVVAKVTGCLVDPSVVLEEKKIKRERGY